MKYEYLNLYTDGGARGNPGPAAAGWVIKDDQGEVLISAGKYLGELTNNQAEYEALILGLAEAKSFEVKNLKVFMDSELIINQMQRKYKVKNAKLAVLFVKAWNLTLEFSKVEWEHILREKNYEADAEVNKALDEYLK